MNYKTFEKNMKFILNIIPKKLNLKSFLKKPNKENPFMVLKNLNLNCLNF